MANIVAILKESVSASHRPGVLEALDARIKARLPEFSQVVDTAEMRVYCHSETPELYNIYHLADVGFAFGILFDRRSGTSFPIGHGVLPEALTQEVLRTKGRNLISGYWGHFVALWADQEASKGRVYALRSPASPISLFYATCDGVRLVFTNPADIGHLGLANWAFDWDYFRFHELYRQFDTGRSGFRNVVSIMHGRCARLDRNEDRVLDYWPLEQVCRPTPPMKAGDAALVLRDAVNDCVQAWASCFDRIALRLSGGLDSSIVACALYLSGQAGKVRCHHFFNMTPEGDERPYARAVANKLGYQLEEIPDKTTNLRYDLLEHYPLGATPTDGVISAFRGAMEYPVLERSEAQVVFSGSSGDAIFVHGDINFAADYLFDRGWSLGFFPVALNAARRFRHSIWSIIWSAIALYRVGAEREVYAKIGMSQAPLMSPEVVEEVRHDGRLRELIGRFRGRGPGKILQAAFMTTLPDTYVTSPGGQRYLGLDPLCSQPVLECCLALPIYDLVWKGWDRGLARLAYERELPECILVREAKGGISNFLEETFEANLDIYRRYFRDSELVKNGVLDAEIVRNALASVTGQGSEVRGAFLVTAATEIWVQRWKKMIEAYEPL